MADPIIVYGIPNCDTVKKTRKWLDSHAIEYEFHDYKKKGIDKATLARWCKELDCETLINRRGTTWRKMTEDEKSDSTQTSRISLMIDNSSIIKRPVIDTGHELLVGFDEEHFKRVFFQQ